MKTTISVILILAGIMLFTMSCKKASYNFTQADLIGQWTEVSPCAYPGQCYVLEFRNNDSTYETSPFIGTNAYTPISNGKIGISRKVIEGPSNVIEGTYSYTITSANANDLTIKYCIEPANSGAIDLHLRKTN